MATFTETETDYLTSVNSIADIEKVIVDDYLLGDGFALSVDIANNKINFTLDTKFLGNPNINKVPVDVLEKYVSGMNQIDDWKNGLLPDFPDLSEL